MTGFLGYEPDRVLALREVLRRTVDELVAVHNPDAAAAPAMADVVRAARRIGGWTPTLTDVLGCTATSVFVTASLPAGDIRFAALRLLSDVGWQVVADPYLMVGPPLPHISATEAAALATALSTGDIEAWLDTEDEIAWLIGRLGIIQADPAAADAFRRALDQGLVFGCVADAWLAAPAGTGGPVRQVFGRLTALMAPVDSLGTWLEARDVQLEPVAMALLLDSLEVAGVGLAGDELAQWCDHVLQRWRSPPDHGPGWSDDLDDLDGRRTGDLLLPLLVDDPQAATAFLLLASEHPDVVFHTTNDGGLVNAVLLTGTNPDVAGVEEAGIIIVGLLDWLQVHSMWIAGGSIGGGYDVRGLLGGLIAPWLLQFGARPDAWGWTRADGDAALRWVLRDEAALRGLIASMNSWQRAMADMQLIDGDGRVAHGAVSDLAAMFSQLQGAFTRESISAAAQTRMWVDLGIDLATNLAIALIESTPIGVAADALVPPTVAAVTSQLTTLGYLPADADIATADANETYRGRVATTAVVAVVTVVTQLICAGLLPDDVLDELSFSQGGESSGCDLEAVRRRLVSFADGLNSPNRPGGPIDPTLSNAIGEIIAAFLSAGYVTEAC